MQGGHLIEKCRLYQLHSGLEKLRPNNHGKKAPQQEHGKGEPEIHRTNVLVVGRKQPTRHTGCRPMMMITHRVLPLYPLFIPVTSPGWTISPVLLPKALRW